jgi:hypothetical protein
MDVARKLIALTAVALLAMPWPAWAADASIGKTDPARLILGEAPALSPERPEGGLSSRRLAVNLGGGEAAELLPAELYGAAYIGPDGVATFFRIDPSTGAGTAIGSVGFQRVSAMDFDASGRLLATAERNDGSNVNVLIEIDLGTGQGTEIGPTGVAGTGFGTSISDISFRPKDGRLYAYIEPGDGVGVIDPLTGAITALGASGIASTGNGLAHDASNTLYHTHPNALNTVDQVTGAVTVGPPLVWSPPADNFPRINALDFHPNSGDLFASVQDGFGVAPENYLATVDLASAVVTIIGASPAGLDALAWRPARAVATLPPMAPALYGSAFSGPDGLATLYRIDPSTGAAAFIGPIGFERVSAMDFDPYGTLYATGERTDGTNENVLITIDIHTGRGTEVGPTNIAGLGLGNVIADIDFRRGDGRLYAYVEPGDVVAVLDPLTGAATGLGFSGAPGSLGNGLSFDAAGARLYHVNENAVSAIDQVTGAAFPLAPTSYLPPLVGGSRANGMDVHPATDVLYVSVRNGGLPTHWLATVDRNTGAVNPIGPSVAGLDAIAWGGVTCGLIDFEGLKESTTIGTVAGAVSVTFGPEWIALIDSDAGGSGNIANEPSADTIALQISGPPLPIELSSGVRFVRLHYVADSSTLPLTLEGWDAPGASGSLVSADTRSTIGVNPPAPCTGDPTGDYCLWDALTLASSADDIRSLALSGIPAFAGYDDLTWCAGPPDILYGSVYSGADGLATLVRLDPDTGAPTVVGPIGYERVSGLDFDARGNLYGTGERNDGSNTSVLLRIDPATGAGTEVGPTGVLATGFGNTFSDLSFRPSDNKLYAYIESGDGVGVIDAFTGAVSALGSSLIGGGGNGIAFEDPSDVLFHANQATSATLNQTTGNGTVISGLVWSPPADVFPRVNGMDFRPRSRALYVSIQDGFGGTPENYLGRLQPFSGVVSVIGPTAAGLDAIAWLSSARPPLPPEVSPPGAVIPLEVGIPAPGLLELKWEPTVLTDSYRLLAGDPGVLRAMSGVVPGNTDSRKCGIPGTNHLIPMPPGNVFFLVAADNTAGTGPLGIGSPPMSPRQGDLICP